ncbi:MAG TPA: glycosyltransferase family 4 protein [Kofleriaceae bacterium]|nr:glycosyltransferase family 4 protein [Kofleriaceae bacterium]
MAALPSTARPSVGVPRLGAVLPLPLGRGARSQRGMKVMLLNQYYHPDIAATAQLAADLGEDLARRGHEVTAIASARPYSGSGWRPLTARQGGVRILRVPATALGRATNAGRAIDYATFLGGMLAPALARPRPDVVVALSTPPLVAAMGLLLKRLRGVRLVYWVMDLYPEVALELGALRPGSRATRALARLARTLVDRADAIVALDDAMRDRLIDSGAAREKIAVIDNWVDGDEIRPAPCEDNALRRELGLGARFTVAYSGNMGLGHDFDTLTAAMARLRDRDMHWLFIGEGPRRASLEAAVRALGVSHTFLGYRARAELPVSLTAAHASIVTLDAGLGGLLAPSKLYGILAAGVPVVYVGPPTGRTVDVIRSHGVGVESRNGDATGLAAAIRSLHLDPGARAEMGRRARDLFESRFTRAQALARHHDLLSRVVAGR